MPKLNWQQVPVLLLGELGRDSFCIRLGKQNYQGADLCSNVQYYLVLSNFKPSPKNLPFCLLLPVTVPNHFVTITPQRNPLPANLEK